MILPTKHLSPDRALIAVGADCLRMLDRPKTVSRLWDDLKIAKTGTRTGSSNLTYDWFVMALDLLYLAGAIELESGLLHRTAR